MGFKASNRTPAEAYTEVRRKALEIKDGSASLANDASSDMTANLVKNIQRLMTKWKSQLTDILQTVDNDALKQYAADQESDPSYDAPVEYVAMRSLMTAVENEVDVVLPDHSWSQHDGSTMTFSTIPAGSLVQLKAALEALSAHIE